MTTAPPRGAVALVQVPSRALLGRCRRSLGGRCCRCARGSRRSSRSCRCSSRRRSLGVDLLRRCLGRFRLVAAIGRNFFAVLALCGSDPRTVGVGRAGLLFELVARGDRSRRLLRRQDPSCCRSARSSRRRLGSRSSRNGGRCLRRWRSKLCVCGQRGKNQRGRSRSAQRKFVHVGHCSSPEVDSEINLITYVEDKNTAPQ